MGKGIFHKPVFFGFCFALFTIFQVCVGVYISGVLTTLEARYRITTSTASVVLSTSDFASLLSTAVVPYFGQSSHRPRIVGVLGLITALGGILSGLPHFFFPSYPDLVDGGGGGGETVNSTAGSSSVYVCEARDGLSCSDNDLSDAGSRLSEAWLLLVGQALMGIAYGPLFPLALTYIDEQVRGKTTPYFISAFLIAGTSSTLLGFGQASTFLRMPVEWPSEDATFTHEKRLGAWWIGFIINGIIMAFISIPFFFFPKKMDIEYDEEPEEEKGMKLEDVKDEKHLMDAEGGDDSEEEGLSLMSVPGFVAALKRIFTNFMLMTTMIATVSELAVAASVGFFLSKYLIVQYQISAADAPLYVGIILMPPALIANVTSGIIVKKFKLTARGCGRFIIIICLIVMACLPALYFLNCPEPNYSGFTNGEGSPVTTCNEDCSCSRDQYLPVCGSDNVTYSTPCFAGCTGQRSDWNSDRTASNITIYTGCTCSSGVDGDLSDEATVGICAADCLMKWVAAGFLCLVVLSGAMTNNPLFMIQLRSVDTKDTTFALGVSAMMSRALGFLPAPLYFGAAIDTTCLLRRESCSVTSDCFIFNAQKFRLIFLGLFFGLKVFSLVFFSMATVKATMIENAKDREEKTKKLEETKNGDLNGAVNSGYLPEYSETGVQTDVTAF